MAGCLAHAIGFSQATMAGCPCLVRFCYSLGVELWALGQGCVSVTDDFGAPPPPLQNLLNLALLRVFLGICRTKPQNLPNLISLLLLRKTHRSGFSKFWGGGGGLKLAAIQYLKRERPGSGSVVGSLEEWVPAVPGSGSVPGPSCNSIRGTSTFRASKYCNRKAKGLSRPPNRGQSRKYKFSKLFGSRLKSM